MNRNTSFSLAMLFWALAIVAVTGGVVFLAYQDKAGWGWLVFILVLLSMTSIKSSNKNEKDELE